MAAPFKYTAEELHVLFDKYLIARSKDFDVKYEMIKSGEHAGEVKEIRLPKVPTIASFCHFIDITEKSFYNWINQESDNISKELFQFVTRVRETIKDKQLSGAMNGIYNPMITSRMNNLADIVNVDAKVSQQTINIAIDGEKLNLTE